MVDGRLGYVTRITTRFVVLKGLDGAEALVPNDLMISSTVVNQTYSDKQMWSSVSIDVAYGTELNLALGLMLQAAAQPRILSSPGPIACITQFGPNGISLQLGFWVPDPDNGFLVLHSDIFLAIWRLFNENQIKLPLPQTEITVLNAKDFAPASGAVGAPAAAITPAPGKTV
jgi:small-conductance mechanosensitive channel